MILLGTFRLGLLSAFFLAQLCFPLFATFSFAFALRFFPISYCEGKIPFFLDPSVPVFFPFTLT